MITAKQANAFISLFQKRLREAKVDPTLNRNVERWTSQRILESLPYDEVIELVDFYFSVAAKPSWDFFARNLMEIRTRKAARDEEILVREKNRQQIRRALDER